MEFRISQSITLYFINLKLEPGSLEVMTKHSEFYAPQLLKAVRKPNERIYVSFLPERVDQEYVTELFKKFGPITKIKVKSKPDGFTFAYITYQTVAQAKLAIKTMCKKAIGDKRLNVSYALETTVDWEKEAEHLMGSFQDRIRRQIVEELKREFQYPEFTDSLISDSTAISKKERKKQKITAKGRNLLHSQAESGAETQEFSDSESQQMHMAKEEYLQAKAEEKCQRLMEGREQSQNMKELMRLRDKLVQKKKAERKKASNDSGRRLRGKRNSCTEQTGNAEQSQGKICSETTSKELGSANFDSEQISEKSLKTAAESTQSAKPRKKGANQKPEKEEGELTDTFTDSCFTVSSETKRKAPKCQKESRGGRTTRKGVKLGVCGEEEENTNQSKKTTMEDPQFNPFLMRFD